MNHHIYNLQLKIASFQEEHTRDIILGILNAITGGEIYTKEPKGPSKVYFSDIKEATWN